MKSDSVCLEMGTDQLTSIKCYLLVKFKFALGHVVRTTTCPLTRLNKTKESILKFNGRSAAFSIPPHRT